MTKQYGVTTIFTGACLQDNRIEGKYHYRYLDTVKVKGKAKALSVYELIYPDEKLKIDSLKDYNESYRLLKLGSFKEAQTILKKIVKTNPDDIPANKILSRCEELIKEGKGAIWNGIQSTEPEQANEKV